MKAFSSNLKEIREGAGMTQEQLAQGMHVTRQAVSRWERGHTEPDIATLIELGKALDVAPEELIFGRKKPRYEQFQRKYVICSLVSFATALVIFILQLTLAPYLKGVVNETFVGKGAHDLVFSLLLPFICCVAAGAFAVSFVALFHNVTLKRGNMAALIFGLIAALPSIAVIIDFLLGMLIPAYGEPIAYVMYLPTLSFPPLKVLVYNILPILSGGLVFMAKDREG